MYKMPTLMGLPSEILISIIDATGPDDIESFSICCKLMYSLARQKLEEHEQKKSLFSTIFVQNDFLRSTGSNYESSKTQLKEFFSDQRNRFYPKTMIVRPPPGFMDESEDGSTARTSSMDGFDDIDRHLECKLHSMIGLDVGGIEAEEWGKHVGAGDSIAILLLLLALLPNLESFRVENLSRCLKCGA